jgi:malate dehydrogenase
VTLRLLELPSAVRAAEGVVMELVDSAFDLLCDVAIHDDPVRAFDGVDVALLVGARPRSKGMERADLLAANAAIFAEAGRALNAGASADIRVVVVGNPANTNALVASAHAPDIPPERFTALTRLDHNRAVAALAAHAGVHVSDVSRVTVWGNHSVSGHLPRGRGRSTGRRLCRRPILADNGFHSDGGQARYGDHRSARHVVGGLGCQRRDRPRA